MPEKVIHELRLNQSIACPADRIRRFSLGTRGSYGVEQLRIVPGEGWDGLTITATFHPPEGEAVQVLVQADGLIDVPPEATRSGSELPLKYGKIVFAGVADGVQRISCNLPYTVLDHAPVEGAESSGPAPSWYEQAAAHFLPGGGKAGQVLAKASNADLDVEWADGGNGTADHAKLSNRDAADQHPISAITGLENALDAKQPAGSYLTQESDPTVPDWAKQPEKPSYTADEVGALSAATLPEAITTALAQATASGAFDGADGSPGKDGVDGKSAYQYAQDGGYTGTETEFAEKLSAEIPTVDSTLTQSGQAADAKAVGDQLSALNEANAEQNTEIAKKANDAELAPVAKSGSYNDLTDKPTISVGGSYLPVNSDDYAADANSVTTTQITKTDNFTLNLPNEITREKWGVIQFVAENYSAGNGTQMYWPIDSAYAGRMYIRGHNHRGWTEWKRYATTSEIPTVPTTLPNPNKLILSGAVTAEYDGSSEVSVEIPAGGSEGSGAGAGSMDDFAIIADVTLAEEVKKIYVNTPEDAAGKYSDYFMVLDFVPPTNTPFTKTSFIGFKPSTAGTIGATKIFGVSGEKSSSHSALITRVKYRDGGDDSWFNYPTMLIPTGSEYAPFYWGAGYRLNNKTWEFACGESYETEIMFGVGTRVRIFARW